MTRFQLGLLLQAKSSPNTCKVSKSVPITNVDDKSQITVTSCVSLSGEFLSVQLIYGGLTDRCFPNIKFLNSFHFTHWNSHWSNEKIILNYLHKVKFPFVKQKWKDLNLDQDAKAVLFSEIFRGQSNPVVTELLYKYNFIVIPVSNNHTNLFQSLDVSVSKRAKCFLVDKLSGLVC